MICHFCGAFIQRTSWGNEEDGLRLHLETVHSQELSASGGKHKKENEYE